MKKRSSFLRSSLGFTFVEALVVMAIFSGFLVATTGVFIAAFRSQAGSYVKEMDEQSNMRGAFELEHAFSSALGYNLTNAVTGGNNRVVLYVPSPVDGAIDSWEFAFTPSGSDSEGRIQGDLSVKVPRDGGTYQYSEVVLPDTRPALFVLDGFGRVTYSWVSQGPDGDVPWFGSLVVTQ